MFDHYKSNIDFAEFKLGCGFYVNAAVSSALYTYLQSLYV